MQGYIFMCSDATEAECFRRGLFGGTEKYARQVRGLKKGDYVYNYNFNSKKLHGVYEAVSEVKQNLVTSAWGGEYPIQVRVRRLLECEPLSREDLKNMTAIKFNAFSRPSARLAEQTAEDLNKLFKRKKRVRTYDDANRYSTLDGHKVKSRGEEKIDNWLYTNGILHVYEPAIPETKRGDFFIPAADIFIEYWGKDDETYIKNKQEKTQIYKRHKLQLLEFDSKNLKNLHVILSRKLL
jgi:hypothetical protein